MLCGKQGHVEESLEGCTSPITNMYQVCPFLVKHCIKETRKRGIKGSKTRTTQVLYSGHWMQERNRRTQESQRMLWMVDISFLRQQP